MKILGLEITYSHAATSNALNDAAIERAAQKMLRDEIRADETLKRKEQIKAEAEERQEKIKARLEEMKNSLGDGALVGAPGAAPAVGTAVARAS